VRSGRFGEVLDAVGEDGQPASQAELSQQMHEWAINAEQALCSAKACGHESGGIERPLNGARQSERDWRPILRDLLRPQVHRIIDGQRETVASSLQVCTCPQWSEAAWATS